MSDNEKMSKEDWKKLEDQAYYELMQIIAEAMQLQDIDLLDYRIASWKNKYKKLLDRPSTDSKSDFKKRIEYLLNQYYSSVTHYILSRLKLREQEKIKNQAKAMRELYSIIRDTNDLSLLKKKVDKWKSKYPISAFISMYQKRIKLYTREKNLKENAFDQEKAFSDLVDITKKNATIDELKDKLSSWEKDYSINNKYRIDDFIKHQSDVKRFVSDEYLISIARDDPKNESNSTNTQQQNNNNTSKQASAYAALLAISKSPNSVDEMFKWVYKNRDIEFNDKYKELILNATYLNYSPTYLNSLKKPKIDMSKSSLSYEEYTNINEIKKYTIISYFNMLLPQERQISNDFFKKIQVVYSKSQKAKHTNQILDESIKTETLLSSGFEVSLDKQEEIKSTIQNSDTAKKHEHEIKEAIIKDQIPSIENNKDSVGEEKPFDANTVSKDLKESLELIDSLDYTKTVDVSNEKKNEKFIDKNIEEEPVVVADVNENDLPTTKKNKSKKKDEDDIIESSDSETVVENNEFSDSYTVVTTSPLFFDALYNKYYRQPIAIGIIDKSVDDYIDHDKQIDLSPRHNN